MPTSCGWLGLAGTIPRCGCGFDQSELTTDKSNKGESCTWYAAYKRAGGYLHNIPLEIGRDRKGVGRRGKMVCSKYTQVIKHHGVTISYLLIEGCQSIGQPRQEHTSKESV